ncbi:hypothetical protein OCU04_009881, partial [Sclerotinia nivalis]
NGKSLSYLLTSSLITFKITIVIIPLIVLKADILNRAKSFNIPCSVWEENREFKNLTLISIESIIKESFIVKLIELINEKKIDRFIIDKCHLLITSSHYRNIMFRFRSLLLTKCQFVFLTSTLPLSIEKQLMNHLSLQNISIIRAPSTRNNIVYKAKIFDSFNIENQFTEVRTYIEDFKITSFLNNKDKIIIFGPSKKDVNSLSSFLNCSFYHSDLGLLEQNRVLNDFFNVFNDFNRIIVSTSGLEEGIDYSSVRLVIYFKFCWSFIGFLQGSSRGGRDLRPSESCFFYNKSEENDKPSDFDSDRTELRKYLRESICRRKVIDLYLDNNITEECLPFQEMCDLCTEREELKNM